ncbi:hypothetical protein CRI94_02345 [Longibacter salinarum]|uniref:Uncharacterized protein n=1 Tax=Longibacter salinarum TaxID=1850348 RepID=A0A2A8D2G8_9BACT|nr:hypothetical protein [Longibacter salinarum]PEN15145.1 hypothetical protein CRI94_02345 [Longibacter salinarum]
MAEIQEWMLVAIILLGVLPIIVAIVDRWRRGKPIVYSDPPSPLFKETFASGNSHRSLFAQLGGATRALVVAVTSQELVVRPFSPATLVPRLPEITGLEHRIPAAEIHEVRSTEEGVDIDFTNDRGARERLTLRLKDESGFLNALSALR